MKYNQIDIGGETQKRKDKEIKVVAIDFKYLFFYLRLHSLFFMIFRILLSRKYYGGLEIKI